jgi:histidinol-phosphate aminotransferase
MSRSPAALVRPIVRRLHAYVPGEQPRIAGLIKLNTNENPYPPAPGVLKATRAAVDGRLRLYPNPTAQPLLEKLARLHRCSPENLVAGNGSDELLAMAVRAFVEPLPTKSRIGSAHRVQFFTPSYSLYPVLAATHGAASHPVPLQMDFSLPALSQLKSGRQWDFSAALTLVTTPNAPSGRGYTTAELERLCREQKGVIVLDEAYVNFARDDALRLGLEYAHVLVARTFSKAYSLCFQRVGYMVGHPELIRALHKIRDSYNVNGLGQIAALSTLDELPYYQARFRQIIATREKLSAQLTDLGFEVLPSQTNFILAKPPGKPAKVWLDELRHRKIVVRWFDQPNVRDYLRITIGTEAEANALVKVVRRLSE